VISDVSEKRDALILEDETVTEESKSCILFFIVKNQQNAVNRTRHTGSQVTLLIGYQLLHVSAARCNHQAVYQQQSLVGPTPSQPQPKLQSLHSSNPGPHTNSTSAHTSCSSNSTQRQAATAAHSQHFVLPEPCAQISLSILDPKGSPPAEAYNVSCARVQRALQYTIYTSCLATRLSSCHISIYEQEQNILEKRT